MFVLRMLLFTVMNKHVVVDDTFDKSTQDLSPKFTQDASIQEPKQEINVQKSVTQDEPDNSYDEVCIVTTGNVDSGKSTLIGTLVTNELDDGNGKLRILIAKHQHEIKSGKTSDISVRTIHKYARKEVVLVDLCGHKKYLGTTIFGLTG